jgi:Cu/Zn superoxide dismutase
LRRITKAALGGVASCALILGATQVASGSLVEDDTYSGELVDLMLTTEGPLDGATATLQIKQNLEDGTEFNLSLENIDPSAAGVEFGSHLHIGPCKEGLPGDAKGHYNHDDALLLPRQALHKTEVWWDLVPNAHGDANDDTSVPFVPLDSLHSPGEMSVVVHVQPTDHQSGAAGDRQACLPLSVPQWDPLS